MAVDNPAMPSLDRSAWSMKAGLSARGNRTFGRFAPIPAVPGA
jgi:hypothetical protein